MKSVKSIPLKSVPVYVWTNMPVLQKREEPASGIYHALRPTILFANIFAMTTLTNATKADAQHLKFKWTSLGTIYSMLILTLLLFSSAIASTAAFKTLVSLKANSERKMSDVANQLGAPTFYISATLSFVLILNVTRKLPSFFQQWDKVAERLGKYVDRKHRRWTVDSAGSGISVKLSTLVTVVFMASAVTEHALHDAYFFSIVNCTERNSFFECYLEPVNDFVVTIFGPKQNAILITEYVANKYANFAWNYLDLLLIQLSLAFAVNFNVISRHIKDGADRKLATKWKVVREDHQCLCKLAKMFDDHISPIFLLSYGINVFFLCKQIYMGIRIETQTALEIVYVITSFVHLVGRIIAVTFSAAMFYDQARGPMIYLLDCPSESFNIEVHRFIDHLNYNDIGFTGWKMFAITRRFFLAIVSVIFTYELLLLDVT